MRAIYKCNKNGEWILMENCEEKAKSNRCVMNKKGNKKFYAFVSGSKIVCVNKNDI